jgi:methionyl aminopeptidase
MAKLRLKTPAQIEAMRVAGKMLAHILQTIEKAAVAGVTPKQLSHIARAELRKLGGEPAFLGYEGYPDVICISVNNQVQHAIPTERPLQKGDIVNLDFGVRYQNMVTDGGVTFCVGNQPNKDQKRLIEGTQKALEAAIDTIRSGCRVGDVSAVIEEVLHRHKLGIVRELVGHGVGYELHEEPEIPNYGHGGTGPILRAGMTIAVEPIATLGHEEIIGDKDGWTLWTADGSLAAQFEHTILVTEDGCEVLTQA